MATSAFGGISLRAIQERTVARLELWHATYEHATCSGRDPEQAVAEADAALAPKPPPKPLDYRNGYRVLIPKGPMVASAIAHSLPPVPMEYHEVFLSPHELREIAMAKITKAMKGGEQ